MLRKLRRALLPSGSSDHLEIAGDRIYSVLILCAALGGTGSVAARAIRGTSSGFEIALGLALCALCVLSWPVAMRFRSSRAFTIPATGILLNTGLCVSALTSGTVVGPAEIFLLVTVASWTLVSGVALGALLMVQSVGTYIACYLRFHLGHGVAAADGVVIDLAVVTFAFCIVSFCLWVGTALFRIQMKAVLRSLERARRRAEESDRAKSRFLANMSHEIRTPMNGILGMIDVCLAEEMPETQRGNLEVARRSADSLIRLLTDILDLAKLESGNIMVEKAATDPSKLVGDIARLFSASAGAKGIRLDVAGTDSLPEAVLIDGGRVGQILSNLLANAIKFTDAGTVTVEASHTDGVLRFCVSDTGCGMAEDFLPHVFSRFRQARTGATTRRGGTGLGLAICRDLCELMGGRISVQSSEGEGSRFEVFLPAPLAKIEAEPPQPDGPAAPVRSRTLNVLIAEDNAVNRAVLEAFLTRRGDRYTSAVDGEEAVAMARDGDFDAILMDVSMPRLDGIEATAAIRALEGSAAQVPILMVTAHVEDSYLARCLEAGADAVLHKPITSNRLSEFLDGIGPEAMGREAEAV